MNNKEVDALIELNNELAKDHQDIQEIKNEAPIVKMEKSLSSFIDHSFQCVKEKRDFEQEVMNKLSSRLNEANIPQLIHILEAIQSGTTNDTNALIAPFTDMFVAKQQLEAEKLKTDKPAAERINDKADKDILQGLSALNQLLQLVTEKSSKPDEDNEDESND
jgi:hypothetical protein